PCWNCRMCRFLRKQILKLMMILSITLCQLRRFLLFMHLANLLDSIFLVQSILMLNLILLLVLKLTWLFVFPPITLANWCPAPAKPWMAFLLWPVSLILTTLVKFASACITVLSLFITSMLVIASPSCLFYLRHDSILSAAQNAKFLIPFAVAKVLGQ